ncbi:hypothetical protein [Marinobacterium sp. BA1]|uniref:hypothetical protein n=1 Tax=Marinobacterium sp. BA1 TaxID=3138931 RepID=UPI0032E7C237
MAMGKNAKNFSGVPKFIEGNIKLCWIAALFVEFIGAVLFSADLQGKMPNTMWLGILLSCVGAICIGTVLMAMWNKAQ